MGTLIIIAVFAFLILLVLIFPNWEIWEYVPVLLFLVVLFVLFSSVILVNLREEREKVYKTLESQVLVLEDLRYSIRVSKELLTKSESNATLKVEFPKVLSRYNKLADEYNLEMERCGKCFTNIPYTTKSKFFGWDISKTKKCSPTEGTEKPLPESFEKL